MQVIIVAGGGGARLWPASNSKTPKQFARIVGHKSSLEHVHEYLSNYFDQNKIWINTNQKFVDKIVELIPGFDPKHILPEPEKRDNFAAVSAQAAILSHKFGDDEPLVFVTSDEFMQYKSSIAKFQNAVEIIGNGLKNDLFEVITMGIRPTNPNVNYGYLELNQEDKYRCYEQTVPVVRFCEKPTFEVAEQFLAQGNFIWNKFNPSFKFKTLKKFLSANDPVSLEILLQIEQSGVIDPVLYSQLPKMSFDYGFMEKAPNMGVVALDINDWVDVGNWGIAADHFPDLSKNKFQTQVSGQNNKVLLKDKTRKVAFVGVSDLVLIENEEGILIIDPNYSADVKQVTQYFDNI